MIYLLFIVWKRDLQTITFCAESNIKVVKEVSLSKIFIFLFFTPHCTFIFSDYIFKNLPLFQFFVYRHFLFIIFFPFIPVLLMSTVSLPYHSSSRKYLLLINISLDLRPYPSSCSILLISFSCCCHVFLCSVSWNSRLRLRQVNGRGKGSKRNRRM